MPQTDRYIHYSTDSVEVMCGLGVGQVAPGYWAGPGGEEHVNCPICVDFLPTPEPEPRESSGKTTQ